MCIIIILQQLSTVPTVFLKIVLYAVRDSRRQRHRTKAAAAQQ